MKCILSLLVSLVKHFDGDMLRIEGVLPGEG